MAHKSKSCLCGETTNGNYAPGHDAPRGRLAFAIHTGILSEADAVRLLSTPKTIEWFESTLATRATGKYQCKIHALASWLEL